jgi:hypothetical protein
MAPRPSSVLINILFGVLVVSADDSESDCSERFDIHEPTDEMLERKLTRARIKYAEGDHDFRQVDLNDLHLSIYNNSNDCPEINESSQWLEYQPLRIRAACPM